QNLSVMLERVGWFTRAHGFQRMSAQIREQTQRVDEALRLLPASLRLRREVADSRLRTSAASLSHTVASQLERRESLLEQLRRTIDALGPMAVLHRGYSIVRRPGGGSVVQTASELEQGDTLEVYLNRGMADVRVESTGPGLEAVNRESDAQPEGNEK
ncbi:exodeoxyribonuclease VII large subunit, partial [Candidatus Zixiibacteriota bacterium]